MLVMMFREVISAQLLPLDHFGRRATQVGCKAEPRVYFDEHFGHVDRVAHLARRVVPWESVMVVVVAW